MNDMDIKLLEDAIALAHSAREHGNHPFGALLADAHGNVLLQAENTVITDADCTGHAETNLMREATRKFPSTTLAGCTVYTSTEPCPMCTGAIFWSQVSRIVYALSCEALYALTGDTPEKLPLPCREILAKAGRGVIVEGPALEEQARTVHAGFWDGPAATRR
jgi:tRNA(Arg) A34 adenosine deaminase TadA